MSQALIAFANGLPAYVLIRVLQPGYFSRKDTTTPTIFAAISVVANIGLSLWLFPSLTYIGIALATTISAWLNAILLATFLALRGHFALTVEEWRNHVKIILISLAMGGMLYLFGLRGAHLLATGSPIYIQASVLAALVAFGMLFYFTLVHISGAQPLGQMLARLRRRG